MSYSTDLRERIVDTVLNKGMTLQKTAETFNVSKSSVERYLHRYRQQGDVTPQTSPGRPSALNEHRSWVEQHLINNDLTHDQRCDLLFETTGIRISRATMCRWVLNRTGFRGDSALTRPAWAWPALECTPSRSPRD